MAKRIITEADVLEAAAARKSLCVTPGECIVTDQARDRALELGVELSGNGALVDSGMAAAGASAGVLGLREQSVEQLVRQACEALGGKLPPGADHGKVERLVREAIESRISAATGSAASAALPEGVVFIESGKALGQGAGSVPAQDRAVLTEVLGAPGGSRLAAGYLVWEGASFNRVVEAPEVAIVIEGELHMTVGGQALIGRPGDMVYLPKGAKVTYSAPSRVKLACVNGVS
jgi:ethanolamine utilization protein EutQ